MKNQTIKQFIHSTAALAICVLLIGVPFTAPSTPDGNSPSSNANITIQLNGNENPEISPMNDQPSKTNRPE